TALSKAIDRPEYIDGLRWFTGNWLRFDAIENQLIVSDLRMGIGSGHYSFRFLVARRNPETGQWTAVTPRYWHGGPAGRDMEALKMVLRRVWQSEPPLPLQQWDMRMTLP
ncbi:MAG TPA: metal-dependent hydrolase, partial [Burkholderiaceae bacterium]|nr:metal-dependent hydrolase [Burkholderiaceae bacterium]